VRSALTEPQVRAYLEVAGFSLAEVDRLVTDNGHVSGELFRPEE
jgi:hypothetical protein